MVKMQRRLARLFRPDVLGHPVDVLHHLDGVFIDIGIDSLDDVAFRLSVRTDKIDFIGVVDVAHADLLVGRPFALDPECAADPLKLVGH